MSHIFISYSKKNRNYARNLADKLFSFGFDVWIDDRIDYGEDWWATIVQAIRNCSAFIVIMTPESDSSRWVQREVSIADELHKPTFPLLLDGNLESSQHWMIFIRTQYSDVKNGYLPSDDFYKRLAEFVIPKPITGSNVSINPAVPHNTKSEIDEAKDDNNSYTIQNSKTENETDINTILPPPFLWCDIAEGYVVISATASSFSGYYSKNSLDGKRKKVKAFRISKYPITNSQFQAFIKADDGYRNFQWWDYSPEAEAWRYENKVIKTAFQGNDLPRTNVNWYEVIAFCRWLTAKSGELITLPDEHQWQRAAQGDDKRLYPWGMDFYKTRCNTNESYIDKPTPVTRYETGASPFGVMDMIGNVREWCLNQYGSTNVNLKGNRPRVIRGGAFDLNSQYATCISRDIESPETRVRRLGFRIVSLGK